MRKRHSTVISRTSVGLERFLPGPIERVWEYLTQADFLASWIADGDIPEQPGAAYMLRQDTDRMREKMPGAIVGKVLECRPPHLLKITWGSAAAGEDAEAASSVVTFTLEEKGKEVLLSILHEKMTEGFAAMVAAGWDVHVETLQARLKGEEPTPFMERFKVALPDYVEEARAKGDEIGEQGKAILKSKGFASQ